MTRIPATEIFERAGISPDEAPEMFNECSAILDDKMATLSATLGMSWERVTLYEEQKDSLVADLVGLKAKGQLR